MNCQHHVDGKIFIKLRVKMILKSQVLAAHVFYGCRATPGVSHQVITDVDDDGHRLVEIFQDSNDTVLDCNILGSK